jgi:hypothetical protein
MKNRSARGDTKDDSWIVCGKLEERGALLLPESKFFSAVTENPALKRNFFLVIFQI